MNKLTPHHPPTPGPSTRVLCDPPTWHSGTHRSIDPPAWQWHAGRPAHPSQPLPKLTPQRIIPPLQPNIQPAAQAIDPPNPSPAGTLHGWHWHVPGRPPGLFHAAATADMYVGSRRFPARLASQIMDVLVLLGRLHMSCLSHRMRCGCGHLHRPGRIELVAEIYARATPASWCSRPGKKTVVPVFLLVWTPVVQWRWMEVAPIRCRPSRARRQSSCSLPLLACCSAARDDPCVVPTKY